MKKLLLLAFLFFCFVIGSLITVEVVFADDYEAYRFVSYYDLEDGTATDQVGYKDGTIEGTGGNRSGRNGYGSAMDLDGTNDWMNVSGVSGNYTLNTNWSINAWIYPENIGAWPKIYSRIGPTNNGVFLMLYNTGKPAFLISDGASTCNSNGAASDSFPNGEWHMITATYDGAWMRIYKDGVLIHNETCTYDPNDDQTYAIWGAKNDGSEDYDGAIDDPSIMIWLNETEITQLYNNMSANLSYPFTTPDVVLINTSYEKTSFFEQIGTTTINSLNFQDVITGTVNITNTTDLYLTSILNVEGKNNVGLASCRIMFDDEGAETEINRSLTSNSYGSMYINGNHIENVAIGIHNISLECRKGDNFAYGVENANLILHDLSDTNATVLPHQNYTYDQSITGSTLTLLQEFNYTTGDFLRNTLTKHLIVEVSETLEYDSTGNITSKIIVNGTDCGEFLRYGTAGSTGSSAHFCGINYVADSVSIPIQIWGKSTSSDGNLSGYILVKEILGDPANMNYSSIGNVTITNTTYEPLFNVSVEKLGGVDIDVVAKASISSYSISGSGRIDYRLRLLNDNSTEIFRDVSAIDQAGVSVLQTVFENLTDNTNYTVILDGLCNAGANNCLIADGDFIVYLSDELAFNELSYAFTLLDLFDNQTVTDFNVTTTEGRTFTTDTGTATIISTNEIENLTVNIGDYFDFTTYNVNLSTTSGTFYAHQAEVSVTSREMISDNIITGQTFYTANKSSTGALFLKAGSHSVTAAGNGYFAFNSTPVTLNALDNITVTTHGYTGNLTVRAKTVGGTILDNITVNVSSYNYTWTLTNQTDGNNIVIPLINEHYEVLVNPVNYSIGNSSPFQFNGTYSLNITVYEENAFNISFRDSDTKDLINFENISLELISSVFSANYSTTNGTLFLTLLSPAAYTLRYESNESYPRKFYYFDLVDETFNNLVLYMTNVSMVENVTITVIDENTDAVENALVKAFRYDLDENDYLLDEMQLTNFEGKVRMSLEILGEQYRFIVEKPAGTQVKVTSDSIIYTNELTIPIQLRSDIAENYYFTRGLYTTFDFNKATNTFEFFYNDPDNFANEYCIYVYKISASNGSNLFNTSCSTSISSTLQAHVTEINGTTYRAIAWTYINGEPYYLGEEWHSFFGDNPFGVLGLIIVIFLIIIAFAVGFWNPIVGIMSAVTIIAIARGMSLINLSWGVTISIWVAGLVVSFLVSKKM